MTSTKSNVYANRVGIILIVNCYNIYVIIVIIRNIMDSNNGNIFLVIMEAAKGSWGTQGNSCGSSLNDNRYENQGQKSAENFLN